jgi:hypothetical protein
MKIGTTEVIESDNGALLYFGGRYNQRRRINTLVAPSGFLVFRRP